MPLDAISWIRTRAAERLPLNLNFVERERPDLLEQAFAGPVPRGWRRTLIDAGVDPYTIVHEHQETVTCAICGYEGLVIGKHLKSVHQIDGSEYVEEYGTRGLSSEQFRASKFSGKAFFRIPHWEQIWSRYYVIDWIIHLKELDHDLSYFPISRGATSLAHYSIHSWGSWDRALEIAGLDPQFVRRIPPTRSWDKADAIGMLRRHAAAIEGGEGALMPESMQLAVRRLFGSTKAAAKAAGLSHDQILLRRVFDSDDVERLVEELRLLATYKGKERCRKLQEIQNRNATNFGIIRGRYSSLKKLAQVHGLDPNSLVPNAYRNPEDVHHDLDMIEQRGLRLCFQTLRKGHKGLYQVILDTGWGLERLEGRLSKRLAATRAKPPLSK